jgi:1-aminocyclopropane-1-carboxylate deaminase/D-cysteine desulfhydrase-like pyridoxal-dependent ACC family enzyme
MIPLFERFPLLTDRLPRLALGEFPTPAKKLSGLCCKIDRDNLYIKRDDISGRIYGGNKVRKLEFLLADAQKQGAAGIITSGGAGSNHALATAFYAKQAGMHAVLMLFRQPNSHAVRENLLMNYYHNGAELFHHDTYQEHLQAFEEVVILINMADTKTPYIIPLGGSSPIGVIGYVNAGFELAEQIAAGEIPLPSRIYLAFGTMGTTAGLLLGLKAAGIKVCIHAVRVVDSSIADVDKCYTLFCQTNDLIRKLDTSFPLCSIEEEDLTIHHEYFGEKYGLYTREAIEAATLLRESDEIILDGTYTGKACAAFIANARTGSDEPILFWNTKNSRPIAPEALAVDYRRLPISFHQYFTEPVQPLDKYPF